MSDLEELHQIIRSDPERAWPMVLAFVREHPESAAGADFIQDFVYEHDEQFIDRIEAAAWEDPILRHITETAYVGGVASEGAEKFRLLQERLRDEHRVRTRFENAPFSSGTSPDAYPTIDDFRIERVPTDVFGIQMRWTSLSRGVLTEFPWWDNLEGSESRLDEADWSRSWTAEDPYIDADQDWAFQAWMDDRFVYVHAGPVFDELTWYRVPRVVFTREISDFRSAVAGREPT